MNDSWEEQLKKLRDELEKYPRMAGYYLVNIVDVKDLLQEGYDDETVVDDALQRLDDDEWPWENRPTDQTWFGDYQVTSDKAFRIMTNALVGGPDIGHTSFTIEQHIADKLATMFDSIFKKGKKYLCAAGLGNPEYVFQQGIAIYDGEKVGIFIVIESD